MVLKLSKNIKTTIDSYDNTAEEYAKNTLEINTSAPINKFLSYLTEKSLILDIGCGPGRDARLFSNKGFDVVGIDLSSKLLEIARKYDYKSKFCHMDVLNMGFPNNTFNGLWAMSSLMHLEKKVFPKALQECYRVLKDESVFYLSLKRGEGESLELDKRYDNLKKYYAYYLDDEVEEIINKSGFEILDFDHNTIDESYATKPWMDIFVQKS